MTTRFYDRYWSHRKHQKLCDFEYKWPFLKDYVPREEGVTILDFGCGTGDLIRRMMTVNPSAEYVGLDVSGVAVESAQKNIPEAEFHLITDGETFPVGDGSVDFIITSEVIEHVYDTVNAFSEMYRVLKPGGKLLITVPYHGIVKNLLIALFAFDRHYDPADAHVRFYTKKTLTSCLREAGFSLLELGYYGRWYPLSKTMLAHAGKEASASGSDGGRSRRIS